MKKLFGQLLNDLADAFWRYSRFSYIKGRMQANRDLKENKFILKTFGPPAKWRAIYSEILKNEHQIVLEVVSEDIASPKLREQIRGYNSVTKEAIRERHGTDFLDMIIERAKEQLLVETKAQNQMREPEIKTIPDQLPPS